MTSVYNLSWISLCKMIAIIHPLRYVVLMTERRCYMFIAANWVFTLVVSPFLFIFPMKWNGHLCVFQVCNSSSLPGFARVPCYTPTPCHMHQTRSNTEPVQQVGPTHFQITWFSQTLITRDIRKITSMEMWRWRRMKPILSWKEKRTDESIVQSQ